MKKILTAVMSAVLALTVLCLVCGCKPEEPLEIEDKPFYTLEEAHSYGWISKSNLKSIAKLVNDIDSVNIAELDSEVLAAIKESYAALRDAESDEVIVIYYGNFNNYYAVDVSKYGDISPSVAVEVTVGGVKFVYPHGGAEVVIYKAE